jgi:hypothetical protein
MRVLDLPDDLTALRARLALPASATRGEVLEALVGGTESHAAFMLRVAPGAIAASAAMPGYDDVNWMGPGLANSYVAPTPNGRPSAEVGGRAALAFVSWAAPPEQHGAFG